MSKKHKSGQNLFLILGESKSLPVIADEIASAALPDHTEVLLVSTQDPGEAIRSLFEKPTRHFEGNPADSTILEKAGIAKARWILVNTTGSPDGDILAVQIVQALKISLESSETPPVILVLTDTEDAREKIKEISIPKMRSFCPSTVFPEIVAQACRQTNLEEVYREFFSHHGNEMHLISGETHVGRSWSELLRCYENACPIGIKQGETFYLNPAQNTLIAQEDEIYVLAHQIDAIQPSPAFLPAPEIRDISPTERETVYPEHFLFLGWNALVPEIFTNLAHYAPEGSKVLILHETDPEISDIKLDNLTIEWEKADPSNPDVLANVEFANWENIVIPGNNFPVSSSQLEILQIVREQLAGPGLGNNITTLIGTPAPDPTPDKDILSTDLLYRLSIQLLIQPALMDVFKELVQPAGTEIFMKPIENYINLEVPVDFYTLLEAARRKNETAIGHFCLETHTITINPQKTEKTLFYHYDKIVVLSGEI